MPNETEYVIYEISILGNRQIEQMGSKRKFWFTEPNKQSWLFKYNREKTGEDWSERIAAEIAELLNIPHADVQLATCEGERGIISKNFTDNGKNTLVHGNELLGFLIPEYPQRQKYKLSKHSINNIMGALSKDYIVAPLGMSPEIDKPKELFLGFLMLDALIGNTDRHHENWGFLLFPEKAVLAPTFDHASSLGRELTDDRRKQLLSNPTHFNQYCNRARSAIYLTDADATPLLTIDAFNEFAKGCSSKNLWLDKLSKISDDSLKDCVEKVPSNIISSDSKSFIEKLLITNKQRLIMPI